MPRDNPERQRRKNDAKGRRKGSSLVWIAIASSKRRSLSSSMKMIPGMATTNTCVLYATASLPHWDHCANTRSLRATNRVSMQPMRVKTATTPMTSMMMIVTTTAMMMMMMTAMMMGFSNRSLFSNLLYHSHLTRHNLRTPTHHRSNPCTLRIRVFIPVTRPIPHNRSLFNNPLYHTHPSHRNPPTRSSRPHLLCHRIRSSSRFPFNRILHHNPSHLPRNNPSHLHHNNPCKRLRFNFLPLFKARPQITSFALHAIPSRGSGTTE